MKRLLLSFCTYMFAFGALYSQTDGCPGTALSATQLNCAQSNVTLTADLTTTFTTLNGIDFGCIDGTTQVGAWYQFTAQGPDIEILDQAGNQPFVAILSACPATATDVVYCGQLDLLDDATGGDDLLTTNQVYYLWVGFDGAPATFSICLTNPPPPPNDNCVDAIDITNQLECQTGSSGSLVGTTEFAGPDGIDVVGCLDAGSNSWEGVWYTFVAQGYDLVIGNNGPNAPHVMIFDDCDINNASFIFCSDLPFWLEAFPDGLDNSLTIGTQYWMWVGFDGGLEDEFEICIDNPVPPVNDDCVNAINIQSQIHCVEGDSEPLEGDLYGALADDQVITGACLNFATNGWEGIWYTFQTEGNDLIIESLGNEDPYILLYDGCPLTGNILYCGQTPIDLGTINDATGDPTNNFLTLDQVPMTIYMMVGFENGTDSTFRLCIENPPPPPNDQCLNAIDIRDELACVDGDGATVIGTTNYSTWYMDVGSAPPNQYAWDPTDDGVLPGCFDPLVDEVVYYYFNAPGVDFEIVDLMNNNPSFAILEYNECMPNPEFIICDEMPYTFNSEEDPDDLFHVGSTYLMMVGFPGGWMATDSFELCVNVPEPPPNDLCENAISLDGRLDCPEISQSVLGWTTNASQEDTYWTNIDPATDLGCMLDTLNDDGVWYSFTAIGTDLVIDDNLGNNPTILLARWNGCTDTIAPVFCAEAPIGADLFEPGNLATTVGEQYLMYVTFQGGETESDTFDLCIDNDGTCSSPQPPNSWCQTTPICGLAALDAFCMDMSVQNAGQTAPWPGCGTNTLDNPNWFSFVAGSDNLELNVQVGDCDQGQGIQIAMYELDCTRDLGPDEPFCSADELAGMILSDCSLVANPQPPGSVINFNVGTEFGSVYAIVIDGWGPDLCQIEIDVVQGADPPSLDGIMLPDPEWDDDGFPFEGDTICAGAEDVRFAVDEMTVDGACRFTWTVNDEVIPDATNSFEEFIDFPDPGVYDVCFFASNFCDSTTPVCIPVVVAALDPVEQVDTICEGDDYVWISPFGEPLPFDPPFTSEDGGDYVYEALALNVLGCTVEATLYLHVLEENDENPTPIDTVICSDDAPFSLYSNDIPIDLSTGVVENFEFDVPIAHDSQCDSFFILDAYMLSANIDYTVAEPPLQQPHVSCFDSVITVCPIGVPSNPLFTPDPDLYPDVEIHYVWRSLPFRDTVGSDSICLVVGFEDFENTESTQRFEVDVIMTKGGRPAGGCTFGPFEVRLELPYFIPDVQILGPDTVCIGPEYPFELLAFGPDADEVFPSPIDYIWDLTGMPGANQTIVDQQNSTFTFDQNTSGQICVTAIHPCSNSPQRCIDVVVASPAVPMPGADDEECTDTYTLMAENGPGIWYLDDGPLGAIPPVFADSSAQMTDVTIVQKGVYTFGYVISAFGCADTNTVTIDFVEAVTLVDEIAYECDNVNENYTATFTFTGGVSPYSITMGSGSLMDSTFVSDPIPQGDTVIVEITDAQNCTGVFVLYHECPCLTQGGTMNTDTVELCGEICETIAPFDAGMEDDNDISIYVLHTSAADTLGTVVDENTTGEFCFTSGGAIQYGVLYYVSLVIGNENNGTVDLDDPCLQIAPGQPIIWYEVPAPDAGPDGATCASTYDLNVMNSVYPGMWEVVNSTTNVNFSDQSDPAATLTALGCGIVDLRWIEMNAICNDTTTITVEFYCNPTNTPPVPSCNQAQTEITFTFQLNGVGPFTERDGLGSFDDNIFEISGITLPMTMVDTLHFIDDNGCTLDVPLQIADCNCLPLIQPDTICGLSIDIVSDGTGNGGEWTVSPLNTGPGSIDISDPMMRATTVSVTEYGVYTLRWTEIGSLCTSFGDIEIHFVNSPEVDLNSIMYTCNEFYDGYTISFEIINGHPASYVVFDENGLPIGQLVGNTFTTNEIPSTQPIQINVADGFGCDTFTIDLDHDCGCFTTMGGLDVTPLNLCIDDVTSVIYDNTMEMRDGNDVLIYVLHTDQNDPLNSIIGESPSGAFGFTDPPMVLGQTYYITAVLGTEDVTRPGVVNYNDPCLTLSDPLPVTWYDATNPMISASEVEFTCLITQINLLVTADNIADYNIVWSTMDGNIEPGDENSANPQINRPGTYVVTLSHAIAGCSSSQTIVVGESDDVPEAVIQQPLLITCVRDEVTVSGAGSDEGENIVYSWSGPGIVGPSNTLDISANQTGTYILTLTDTTNGCQVSASIDVFDDLTQPDAQASVSELLDCNTMQVTVSGNGSSSGNAFTYQWTASNGGNIIGSSTGLTIEADAVGTYQIEVTNTTNGCVSVATVNVEEDNDVIRGATIDAMQLGCDGELGAIFVANVDGGTGPIQYSFDGGLTFSETPLASDLQAGTYDLVITDANGCVYDDVVVLVQPVDFMVELGETIIVDQGEEVTVTGVTDLADSLIQSISWSPVLDSLNPGELTQVFYPAVGQTNVILTVTSLNGCIRQDNLTVLARFKERIYIPNAMNPNSPIRDNQRIYIYADPASVAAIHKFEIYDRWGERMFIRENIPVSLDYDEDYAWDGLWKGELAHTGVYVYYAEVELVTGRREIVKGDFTLLR